jgi:MoaA/NifB/PqqE/SkfB family radical SAM enzyme
MDTNRAKAHPESSQDPTSSHSRHEIGEVDFTAKLLMGPARKHLEEYVQHGVLFSPTVVEFDATTACQYGCPECISRSLLNRGHVAPEVIKRLLADFRRIGVEGVVYSGGGEPLMHPAMPKPLVWANELGLRVGLVTNGALLGVHGGTVAERVQWTRISVDAASEEMYALMRPSRLPNAFSRLLSNIQALTSIACGTVGCAFLVIERHTDTGVITNCGEVYDSAVLARNLGCDYFEVRPAVSGGHHLRPLAQENKGILVDNLRRLEALASNRFRIICADSLRHLLHSPTMSQPKAYRHCPTLEFRTVVSPTGMYPCPYKRGVVRGLDPGLYQDFGQAWQSIERRQAADAIDPSRDCQFYCIRHCANLVIGSLRDLRMGGVDLLQYITPMKETDDVFI